MLRIKKKNNSESNYRTHSLLYLDVGSFILIQES